MDYWYNTYLDLLCIIYAVFLFSSIKFNITIIVDIETFSY